jgi:hypothetical protein
VRLWTPPGADLSTERDREDEAHRVAIREKACRDLNRARTLLQRLERKPLNSNGRRRDLTTARVCVNRAQTDLHSIGHDVRSLKGAPELIDALTKAN